jgi:hypothetical protein
VLILVVTACSLLIYGVFCQEAASTTLEKALSKISQDSSHYLSDDNDQFMIPTADQAQLAKNFLTLI